MNDNVVKFPVVPRHTSLQRDMKLAEYNRSTGIWAAYTVALKTFPDSRANKKARNALLEVLSVHKNNANRLIDELGLPEHMKITL